jgi:capsule polysaccharide export protein KpsE/RkpR
MTAAQNVQFVSQQLETFRAMHADVDRVLAALRARSDALRQGVASQRTHVRALKEALVGQSNAPSIADVTKVVTTLARRDAIRDNRAALAALRERLPDLAAAFAANRDRLKALQTDQLTPGDSAQIAALEAALRFRLAKYQFDSLPPAGVDISRETYRPAHEGFDLGFDISASDMIRVIWAYLMSMLSVSGEHGGNHLGLLVFDEPRQQETARESYEQLLQQAADEAGQDRQILFATSETSAEIRRMLGSATHNLIDFAAGTRIIQPKFEAEA